jgi:aspartate-semialdehyde dehydrogenase
MSNKEPVIAIVGATGLVGSEMLAVLEQCDIPVGSVRLLASKDSEGEVYKFRDMEAVVEELTDAAFQEVDFALFATSSELSQRYVPVAVDAGARVIDNSSAFRLQDDVPLVVPEVNGSLVSEDAKVIANPNCSTIQLIPVLKAVDSVASLKRVVVSTYQSVSGAGRDGLDELWSQTLSICNQSDMPQSVFDHQIAFNCIPQIDAIYEDGYTGEELKVINESRKILGMPDLALTATAVRVPVFYGHAESVNIETQRDFSMESIIEAISSCEGLELAESPSEYPMQVSCGGTDVISIGRLRRDKSVPFGLALWIVADNVRKGAALNAIQILERMISR